MSTLQTAVYGLQILRNVDVATVTLLVTDWLFCFQDEVEYIWGADWNSGKILYLLTRYSTVLDVPITMYRSMATNLSPDQCESLYRVAGWMIIVGFVISEVIMTVCIWNLYGRDWRIALFLTCVWATGIAVTATWCAKFLDAISFALPGVSVPGCYSIGSDDLDKICFSVLVVLETLLLLMTVVKAYRYYRTETTSFIDTVLKHWIIYFLLLDLVSASNLILLQAGKTVDGAGKTFIYQNMLTSLQRVLHSIMSARIILRIRQQAQKKTHAAFDLDSGTVMTNLDLGPSCIAAGEV